jgi:hypothetical protein
MRSLSRGVVLALVCSAVVLVRTSNAAYACDCGGLDGALADPDSFKAAFVGTVVARSDIVDGGPRQQVRVTFRVDEVYRGDVPAVVDVVSARGSGACGFDDTPIGAQMGVLLYRDELGWTSGSCSLGPPEKVAVLGAPRGVAPPVAPTTDENDSGVEVLMIWGAVLAAVAVSTALIARRRGRSASG